MTLKTEPNFSHGYNFILTIPELPIVSELAQDFLLPPLTLNPAEVPNRFVDFGLPGEKLVYGELDIGFIMDSNMDAFIEIHNWMRIMAGTYDQPVEQRKMIFTDTTLHILNNSKNQVRKFTFFDSWPTALGATAYDLSGPSVIKSILSMQFTGFDVSPADSDLSMFTKKVYETDVA